MESLDDAVNRWQEHVDALLEPLSDDWQARVSALAERIHKIITQPRSMPAELLLHSRFSHLQNDIHRLASHHDTPPVVLSYLADCHSSNLRARIAEHPKADESTLCRLANDCDHEVRVSLAQNPTLPLHHKHTLAGDPHPDVRFTLAEDPGAGHDVLRKLAGDSNPYVAMRAEVTLARLEGRAIPTNPFSGNLPSEDNSQTNTFYPPSSDLISDSVTNSNSSSSSDSAGVAPAISELLEKLSHQLRTELGAMMGLNELLLDSELKDDQKTIALSVKHSSERLLDLLNDFTKIRELAPGEKIQEPMPFNLIFLVQESTRLFTDAARARSIMLTTQIDQRIPEFLLGQPHKLRELLGCLVSNSINNTSSGKVSVEALIESLDDHIATIRFVVSDTGKGVSPEEEAILSGKLGSTGSARMSLSVSREIVLSLGGSLAFSSQDNLSQVTFYLPFERMDVPCAGQGQSAIAGKQVLVVEDNPTLLNLLQRQLERFGLIVDSASHGREALALVHKKRYDLILLDCYLPELDGFRTANLIRTLEDGRSHVPIIAVTAAVGASDRRRCEESGMDDFLTKPVSSEKLRQKLEQWLDLSSRIL